VHCWHAHMARRNGLPVKAVVLGDEGAGKTSLITAVATESFPDHPPPVLPHTKLPPDATPEGVPMVIMDTSSRDEERTALEACCHAADVVLLLFATDRADSLEKVRSRWMPELRRIGVRAPVILVGTKSDLKSTDLDLQQAVVEVMSSFKEIETCLECSAKHLVFVAEVFYYAVKAVVHPTAALFDAMTQTLKPRCVNALKRIFMLCDKNQDDALDDAELNAFQVRCFSAPLQPEELMGVKKVVQDKMPQGVNGTGLTLSGFLFLHALFIERGRLETTWAVLRKFGYSDELRIADEVLNAASFTRGPDQVVELNPTAQEFLTARFRQFDRNRDGMLSSSEQEEAFSTAPFSPWTEPLYKGLLCQTGPNGLTEAGWQAKWAFTAANEPRKAYEWLLYLGYDGPAGAAVRASRTRRQERRDASSSGASGPLRSVFQGLVFGGAASGKTTLLARLAAHDDSAGASSVQPGTSAAAGHVRIKGPDGDSEAVLLLRELSEGAAAAMLKGDGAADTLAGADAAAFVFDSTSLASFRTAHQLMLAVTQTAGDVLPCIFVAAKDDLGMSQDLSAECSAAMQALHLPAPVPLSAGSDEALARLVAAAQQDSQAHIPLTPSLRAAQQQRRLIRRTLLYTAGITCLGAAAYGGFWWYKNNRNSFSAWTGIGRSDGGKDDGIVVTDNRGPNSDVRRSIRN